MKNKRKDQGTVDKSPTEQQLRNWMLLPLLCEKSGVILLGLMAGSKMKSWHISKF